MAVVGLNAAQQPGTDRLFRKRGRGYERRRAGGQQWLRQRGRQFKPLALIVWAGLSTG